MLAGDIRSAWLDPDGNISAEDLTCTICCSIFVEPVVLPCGHGFCLGCFNGVIAFNSLTCPCCRKRFGNWLRNANRNHTLVNQSLWKFIQTNFSEDLGKENLHPPGKSDVADTTDSGKVEAKIQTSCTNATPTSADATTKLDATGTSATAAALTAGNKTIAQPGEIRKEFEAQLENFRKERERERENELIATTEFIVKLLEEELNTVQDNIPPTSPLNKPCETMLVANPGHTPYSLTSTKNSNSLTSSLQTEPKKHVAIPSLSKSNSLLSHSTSSVNHNSTSSIATASQAAPSSSTAAFLAQSTKCSLIKTLAVRLNRGTDILKQSVHKAIISKIPQNFLSGTSNREVLTVPPTNTHREPNSSANSTDSLRLEMCHFKPIRTVPTTPSKKNKDELLRTPKARRMIKFHMNERGKAKCDLQPSSFQKILQQSPRKSAFCLVIAPTKQSDTMYASGASTSSSTIHHELIASNTCDKRKVYRKNPVVLLRRLSLSRSKTKNAPGKTGSDSKIEISGQNGLLGESYQGYKFRGNKIYDTKLIYPNRLEKLIREQKRCEELLEQEKRDFEIARQLEAELNVDVPVTVERPTLRRRRKQPMYNESVITIDDSGVSVEQLDTITTTTPPAKRCRRTCGRILSLKETEDAATLASSGKATSSGRVALNKSQQNAKVNNLRRSGRNPKPTRRYIV